MKRIVAPCAADGGINVDVAGDSNGDPTFSAAVIAWQKVHGRHALPWQQTHDAYRIWLSEIMLQQTQVAAVVPYYQKFLVSFPTVQALAAAPSDAVMALWSGLGYYTRARNLQQCAKRVVADHAGIFPNDPVLLAELPGIGRSTAAAIAAFAYGRRAAILDGNVKRVFSRVFGVEGYPGSKPVEDRLWLRAQSLLPQQSIEAYTQGLMDLGATLCSRNRPDCQRCPLAPRCVALATGRVHLLPTRKEKKVLPQRQTAMLVVVDQQQILLEQRPDYGIWGGLLSLPELAPDPVDQVVDPKQFEQRMMQQIAPFGVTESCLPLTPFAHGFTHFKLQVTPFLIKLSRRLDTAAQQQFVWYSIDKLAAAPLPAPVKKLLMELFSTDDLFTSR